MANDLTAVAPRILAQGLLALRQQAVITRLVNLDYSNEAKQKGTSVDVPIPSAIAAQAVVPAATPQSTGDSSPTYAPVTLDQWFEAPFYMTDADMMKAMAGVIPMQVSEAVKALSNNVAAYCYGLYKGVFGFVGTAGTTPFGSDTAAATDARLVLNKQLAPMDDRRAILNPDAEAKALALAAFQFVNQSGTDGVMKEGNLGRKLGFDWYMDQLVPTHTSTALSAGAATVNGAHAAGVKTVSIAKATNTSPLVKGDIITFAGDSQTYVVTADVTLAVGNTNVSINPGLATAKSGSEAVTLKASHVANLALHRDAIALAVRPLEAPGNGLGNIIQSAVDPQTGLALRLEISREHKRTRWSFDILYGATLVRPELATRIAG